MQLTHRLLQLQDKWRLLTVAEAKPLLNLCPKVVYPRLNPDLLLQMHKRRLSHASFQHVHQASQGCAKLVKDLQFYQ